MDKWSAIILTTSNLKSALAYNKELELLKEKHIISEHTVILSIEDPNYMVGSGGATLNAILQVAEYFSAKKKLSALSSDILDTENILLIHMGRSFIFDICGRGFIKMVSSDSRTYIINSTNFEIFITTISQKLAANAPPGVWVCSSDMFLNIESEPVPSNIFNNTNCCVMSIPVTKEHSLNHGVYEIDHRNQFLKNIYYKCSDDNLLNKCVLDNSSLPLVIGIIYMGPILVNKLLSIHSIPPLTSCTYIGCDNGLHPIQLSLFFDLLLAMCTDINKEEFIGNNIYSVVTNDIAIKNARRIIWENLHGIHVQAVMLKGTYNYIDENLFNFYQLYKHIYSHSCENLLNNSGDKSSLIFMNSDCTANICLTGNESVVLNSRLTQNTILEKCFLNDVDMEEMSLDIHLENNIGLFGYYISNLAKELAVDERFTKIYAVIGMDDDLNDSKTICNQNIDNFFNRTGIVAEDLWPSNMNGKKCLMNAKLYPIYSSQSSNYAEIFWLQSSFQKKDDTILNRWKDSHRISLMEILSNCDIEKQFYMRRFLKNEIAIKKVSSVLSNGEVVALKPLLLDIILDGYSNKLLDSLHKLCMEHKTEPALVARVLASIANVLSLMSEQRGSALRNGPASNLDWQPALRHFEDGNIEQGLTGLNKVCINWRNSSMQLMRACRHYEEALRILIRKAVASAKQFIELGNCEMPTIGSWIMGSCPARIDICGGWSDTPPITYEHGGAVLNAAITINGKKPIGAKVRRINELKIILHLEGGEKIEVLELNHMENYNQPEHPGALLKCALIVAEIIDLNSKQSLKEVLQSKYKSGFELTTWSNLPHGSGLGTSSILAGAVLAVLWKVSGKSFSISSLNHAVLYLEQVLTTGGGWQDQVGGLLPSIKMGYSDPILPLKIQVKSLDIDMGVLKEFNERLVLVYTGKTRLAKNLLQNVLRTWYDRDEYILKTEDDLVSNAWICYQAFLQGNLNKVGSCMSAYWEQKKRMAPGCEPNSVAKLLQMLEKFISGATMAGAGGGGFLYLLLNDGVTKENVRKTICDFKSDLDLEIYEAEIDMDGLVLEIESNPQKIFIPLH